MNRDDGLNLVELDLLLGAPDVDDAAGIAFCHLVVDVLAVRYGDDHIIGLLAELGELERAAGQYDDDD